MKGDKAEFAKVIGHLLDDHGVYTRAEWATMLGVSEPAISQWVGGNTFPRPESWRRIARTLEEDLNIPESFAEDFEALSKKPLRELGPPDQRSEPTLAHYMVRPLREAFLRVLDTLAPELQEEVLLEAAERARQRRGESAPRPSVQQRRERFHDIRPRRASVGPAVKDAPLAAREQRHPHAARQGSAALSPASARAGDIEKRDAFLHQLWHYIGSFIDDVSEHRASAATHHPWSGIERRGRGLVPVQAWNLREWYWPSLDPSLLILVPSVSVGFATSSYFAITARNPDAIPGCDFSASGLYKISHHRPGVAGAEQAADASNALLASCGLLAGYVRNEP